MTNVGNLFWALVLAGSLIALAAGFAGGRSFGNSAVAQLHPQPPRAPAPLVVRRFDRELHGLHSLDEAEDPRDAYDAAEAAVVDRPDGWPASPFDARRDRARVALVVVDAGIAGTPANAFVRSPIPFTLVVPAGDDNGVAAAARGAGKAVLVDASSADDAAALHARLRSGASGTLCDAAGDAARAAVAATGTAGIVLDPLLAGDGASYRAAREAGVRAVTRDVIVDGRDSDTLMDTLFLAALRRAQRTGVAAVLLHARPHSLAAAERFAVRAQRDGVDIVPIDQLPATATATAKARPT